MWCALNCQAYRTPPYYPPLLYFARGFFSGIDPPALLCSPMGIAVFYIHPVFLLQASLCQMFHRGAKINLSVKQKLHFLSSWTNLAIFWGGNGAQIQQLFHKRDKIFGCRYRDEKTRQCWESLTAEIHPGLLCHWHCRNVFVIDGRGSNCDPY